MKKELIIYLIATAGWLSFPIIPTFAQNEGCTDPLALNYNFQAEQNDGSCNYANATIMPVSSHELPDEVMETSGLTLFNKAIWTHNDDTDTNLYSIPLNDIEAITAFPLPNVTNTDWEEITQDETWFYIGDFGNNSNGNRTDLHILRVGKQSLLSGQPVIDTIWFVWEDQTDFDPTGPNNTAFDCEAFVVVGDSLFLFTKDWISQQTRCYVLPKTPGDYEAQFRHQHNVNGLITGATTSDEYGIIVLTGYSSTLQPFLYLLYDYPGTNFFNGNKRKIILALAFHQVEGITSENGIFYYISNERFQQSIINVQQKIHTINLFEYLGNYIYGDDTGIWHGKTPSGLIYPNPVSNWLKLPASGNSESEVSIYNQYGSLVYQGSSGITTGWLDVSMLTSGVYYLSFDLSGMNTFQFIKI